MYGFYLHHSLHGFYFCVMCIIMKVLNIERDGNIFTVTLQQSFFKKLLGYKNEKVQYKKEPMTSFKSGGGGVYYARDGSELPNFHPIQIAIDNFIRSW